MNNTTKITLEIENDFLPEFYAILKKQLSVVKELACDEEFCKKFPALGRSAERATRNISNIVSTLVENI